MSEYKHGCIDIIRVEWLDSNTWSGWHSVANSLQWAKSEFAKCESVGYLVYENEEKLVLAMNLFYGKDEDPEIVETFGDLMAIPKFAIKKRELVYKANKKGKK